MERELENRIFMFDDYKNKEDMEKEIEEYIGILKNKNPNAIITREFYKGKNILVRATELYNNVNTRQNEKDKEREVDDWYIRQRGER